MLIYGTLFGTEEFVPAFFVDSDWKLITNLSNELKEEDYYLFVMKSEDEINILTSGDFYIAKKHEICGWFDNIVLYKYNLIGYEGLSSIIGGYIVYKGGNCIYEGTLFDEGFDEVKAMVEQTKKTENDITEEGNDGIAKHYDWNDYSVDEYYILSYDGLPLFTLNDNQYVGYLINILFQNPRVYDIISSLDSNYYNRPNGIRKKDTKEEISYEDFYNLSYNRFEKEEIDRNELNSILNNYEYHIELLMSCIKKGNAIIIE